MEPGVLITGAAGGIGHALCRAFSEAGYFVVATDRDGTADLPHPCIPLDLNDLPGNTDVQQTLLQDLESALKGRSLRTCVNNAATQILSSTEDISDCDFQYTINVNLTAPLVLVRLLLPQLERTKGSVVNIGSIHSRATKAGFVSYATSKTALLGLTQALAVDLRDRVRVNIIQPAAVATEMLKSSFTNDPDGYRQLGAFHPIGRIAEPAEIARVAVFLASRDASFITGSAIDVDGGIGVRLHDPDDSSHAV